MLRFETASGGAYEGGSTGFSGFDGFKGLKGGLASVAWPRGLPKEKEIDLLQKKKNDKIEGGMGWPPRLESPP